MCYFVDMKIFKLWFLTVFCTVVLSGWATESYAQKSKDSKKQEKQEQEAAYLFSEAEKYFLLENYSKSYKLFNECLEKKPNQPTVLYKLAELAMLSGNLKEAEEHIEKALNIEQNNPYFYLLAVDIYTQHSKLNEAALAYEKLVQNVPGNENYFYNIGGLYLYMNELNKALIYYEKAEAHFGVNEENIVQQQKVYLKKGDVERLMSTGERLIQANPGEERYVIVLAEMLLEAKRTDKAIEVLELFLKTNKGQYSWVVLTDLYRTTGQKEQAAASSKIAFYGDFLSVDQKLELLVAEIKAVQKEDKPSSASLLELVKMAKDLKKKYPDEVKVLSAYADVLYLSGDNKGALEAYQALIALQGNRYSVWKNTLILAQAAGQPEEVVQVANKALEVFPNQAEIYHYLGWGQIELKEFEEALYSLQQGERISRGNKEIALVILPLKGVALAEVGQLPEAYSCFEKALQINSESKSALKNYSYYLSLGNDKLSKAESMAQKLLQLEPDNPTYLDVYGWVLFKLEKYEQAKDVFKKAIAIDSSLAERFNKYGDVLFKAGDVSAAVEQWEKAKELDGSLEHIDLKIKDKKLYE